MGDGEGVTVTNPDKVLFPSGFTKGDVVAYYAAVAPVLVPHLRGRAVTLRRFPDGVGGTTFYEKRAPSHRPPWMPTVEVRSARSGDAYTACTVDDARALLWLANLAALELHPQLACASAPGTPTALVFDLDPGAPAQLAQCAEVACWIGALLSDLGLEGFVKTSGSKGLQLYVPLNTEVAYETTKGVARTVAMLLEASNPELVVSSMRRASRVGRVLVDWSQNDRVKTTVAPYSLRATASPGVSTPLEWSEVEALRGGEPVAFGPQEVIRRVGDHGDLFAAVLDLRQELPGRLVDAARGGRPT